MKVLLPYLIILKGIHNGESLHKFLSYSTLLYNSTTTSNTKLYVIITEHRSKLVPYCTNLLSLMVLSLYFILNIILCTSESLHKLLSYYILIDNNIPTSNSKLYNITIVHTSKLVPNDTNIPSMKVLLPYFIIIKVIYTGELQHKILSYFILIYNRISTSNINLFATNMIPNY